MVQQRIRAREAGDKAKEQDLHKQVRSQARHIKTQWLKDRLAESEETVDARMMEVDKAHPVRVQAETGIPEEPREQAHQFLQTGANLCGRPIEPTMGPSAAQIHRQPRTHPPPMQTWTSHPSPSRTWITRPPNLPKTEQRALTTFQQRRGNGWTATTGPTS